MPSPAPYIPTKESLLDAWFANFSTLISAAPATYGLTSSDATSIAAAVATWHAAYLVITSPTTKTKQAVSAKNTAKHTALAVCRPYAQTVSLNAGVSSANKTALGVNPRTSTPTPVPVPTTSPVLTAQSTSTAGTIIRYRDATASPSVKAKPAGVKALQLFGVTSATPITTPDSLPLLGSFTKSPLTATLGSAAAGKIAYFAARWITQAGKTGPWSSVISYPVAG